MENAEALIFDRLCSFLDQNEFNYNANNDFTIDYTIDIDSCISRLNIMAAVEGESYSVFAVAPICADYHDVRQISEICRFITMVNYMLKNGSFQVDLHDGEIRYKTFVNCRGQLPDEGIIMDSLYLPMVMFERYTRGFLSIILEEKHADEAYAICENEPY